MSKNEIEKQAEHIFFLLSQQGSMSLNEICGLIDDKRLYVILSIGLLIKENKVSIYEKEGDMIIESSYSFSNLYY
jgi:uncharacterized membrane protein affecting hemolysin expression